MLPDLPAFKADILIFFHLQFKNRVNVYLGVVGEAPRCIIKEGKNPVILRGDSSRDETKLQMASAETIFENDRIPNLSVQERIDKLDIAARDMASQISSRAFATINEAVEKVGNVVDAQGKPLNPESIFQVLEKIQMDFDDAGNPKDLFIVIPPALTERAKETIEEFQRDPELNRRYQEIVEKKREEWRDREAARKLVG